MKWSNNSVTKVKKLKIRLICEKPYFLFPNLSNSRQTHRQSGAIRIDVGRSDDPCAAKQNLREAIFYIYLNINILQDKQNNWFCNILSTNPISNLHPPTIVDLRRSEQLISFGIFWLRRSSGRWLSFYQYFAPLVLWSCWKLNLDSWYCYDWDVRTGLLNIERQYNTIHYI